MKISEINKKICTNSKKLDEFIWIVNKNWLLYKAGVDSFNFYLIKQILFKFKKFQFLVPFYYTIFIFIPFLYLLGTLKPL